MKESPRPLRWHCLRSLPLALAVWEGKTHTESHSKAHRGGDEEPTKAYFPYVEESDEETTKM